MNDIIYYKRFVALYYHFIAEVEAMQAECIEENHEFGISLTSRKLKELNNKLAAWELLLANEIKRVKHERKNNSRLPKIIKIITGSC